jgi:signal transduction histidine kinase
MIRARCHGPLPEEPPVVLDGLDPARWRALLAVVDRRFERSRALLLGHVVGYVFWGSLCMALWRIGYPTWRVAGLAGFLALVLLSHLRGGNVPDRQKDQRVPFLGVTLGAALTGGLHSPLLIALPGHFAGEVIREGWSRATVLGLVTFGVSAVAMAIAPAAWIGPPIPDPIFTVTLVVLLLFSTALQTNYLVVLIRTSKEALRQLLRSREEQATEALARASQLEQLSSQLSHELKNPLGAIKALVQLSVRAERDPDVLARLEVVQGEVERMQSILQGYLSFSRPLQALRLQPVELGPLVDEVLAILEGRAAAARVTTRRRGDAAVTADPRSLKQAIVNLVANAIEASAPGSGVEVVIDQPGERTRLQVVDAGRGMSAEELARVGTPFFTTRAAGTGLGVSLARGVFAQHGGTLEYQSEPGRGTIATATFPTHAAEAPPDGTRTAGR